MPGLVNAHTHSAMVLFRGRSEGQSLLTMEGWYNSIREPELSLVASDIGPAVALSCAEMVLTGTTTFCDQYFCAEEIAEAVKQAGKTGKVHVMGLGLPSENRRYVKEGVTDSIILWKTEDLGYLTVQAAVALAKGTLKPGAESFTAGPLGTFQIKGDNILLGTPFVFNKENIDQFNF